jgi:hypothetical protein
MDGSNYINPNLLPPVDTSRKTLLHTKDRVGIGLLNPQQKLHVHGSQAITGGRLGIGTHNPSSVLHILDNNGPGPTVRIEQQGSVDVLQIVGSNARPLLYINGDSAVGIGTATPSAAYGLTVEGIIYSSNGVRTNSLTSDGGVMDCSLNTLSNILNVFATNAEAPTTKTNTIQALSSANITVSSAVQVTGWDATLYDANAQTVGSAPATPARIGLRVYNNIMSAGYLSVSDRRIKHNISKSRHANDLDTVLNLHVYDYTMNNVATKGFIAQEVEEVVPSAVKTTTAPVPCILQTPSGISNDRTLLIFAQSLPLSDIPIGSSVRVLVGETEEHVIHVADVTEYTIRVTDPVPFDISNAFVYGVIVRDFKLLDSERLLPFAYGAIKSLHATIAHQQQTIDTIMERLVALEQHVHLEK